MLTPPPLWYTRGMEAKALNHKSEGPEDSPWVEAAIYAIIPVILGLFIIVIYAFPKKIPLNVLAVAAWWMLLALAAGWVVGTVLHWLNQRLIKKSRVTAAIAVTLVVAQTVGSFALGVTITPVGLYSCANQGESVDWVNDRCQYVFSGKMIDVSYPILHKDERTTQDGDDVVKLGSYTVKNGDGEGTIKTRNYKITENSVDPSLVGRDLDVILHSEGGWSAQVEQHRSLAGPLGGKSPTEGFCYDGTLYEAYYVNRGTRLEAKVKGTCPAGDDSIPHMDNR